MVVGQKGLKPCVLGWRTGIQSPRATSQICQQRCWFSGNEGQRGAVQSSSACGKGSFLAATTASSLQLLVLVLVLLVLVLGMVMVMVMALVLVLVLVSVEHARPGARTSMCCC